MDVFEAFPNAIIMAYIAPISYGTIEGNRLGQRKEIHVIIDEGSNADQNSSPMNASIQSDTLIYCKPHEMPTTDASTLVADYAIISGGGQVFAIEDAGIGRDQDTGRIEHIELKIRPTGAIDESSE